MPGAGRGHYVITRLMRPEDRRFVVPTWVYSLASLRKRPPRAHDWRSVDRILDAPDTCIVVLASDEAARALHAWAAATGDTLHYAYVPPELRGAGLARRCITAALGAYPEHITTSVAWPFAGARFQQQRTAA